MAPTALERAFQLAESGKCSTVAEIRMALSHEGYSLSQIAGPTLLRQLRELIRKTKEEE